MCCKITVYRDPLFILCNRDPFRISYFFFPFLQEQNIRSYFCPCIFKCSVWQPDCSQKFCPLKKILPYFGIFLIHRPFCCDKCSNTTWTQFIQCLYKKIVMDQKSMTVINRVIYPVIPKGNISDSYVKISIWIICTFKPRILNIYFWIKITSYLCTHLV